MIHRHLFPRCLLVAVATTAALSAQVTYVDADLATNTTLADGTAYAPPVGTVAGSGTDNEWLLRPFANGGTIISSHDEGSSNEDAPMLRTRISGLLPGLDYLVYSYWWSDGQAWRGRAQPDTSQPAPQLPGYNTVHFGTSSFSPMQPLANGAAVGFEQTTLDLSYDAAGFELDGHFSAPVLIAEGNRTMYELVLGRFTADLNGEIDVYIDDLEGSQASSNRTWYDGVGYELAPLPYGGWCGNAQIGMTGVPHRTTQFSIDLVGGDPNALGLMIVGFAGIPALDLGTIGFTPGCFLNVDFALLEPVITDANGDAAWLGSFGTLPSTNPIAVNFQWATFDASLAVGNTTQGLEVFFHY